MDEKDIKKFVEITKSIEGPFNTAKILTHILAFLTVVVKDKTLYLEFIKHFEKIDKQASENFKNNSIIMLNNW